MSRQNAASLLLAFALLAHPARAVAGENYGYGAGGPVGPRLDLRPFLERGGQAAPNDAVRLVGLAQPGAPTALLIQLGAFKDSANAKRVVQQVSHLGPTHMEPVRSGRTVLHRVRLGPFGNADDLAATLQRVRQLGFRDAAVVRGP